MNFEDLQKSWQGQPVNVITDTSKLKSSLQTRWEKYQSKLFKQKVYGSILLLVTLVGIGWVYLAFHELFRWPFTVSIAAMYALILVYIFVSWKSYAFKKENLESSSAGYISYQLDKLKWQRKTVTLYTWIYLVLLWLSLVMYISEVAAKGTVFFQCMAVLVVTTYILGVHLWYRYKKQKKVLSEIDEMTADLQQIRQELTD
ncbi:hypothetical protein [Pedobacter cryoconitis]|uniref:Membrane protein YdbS with pleckstrin-like domain n=1 Tax=Pedobacter cryoconitis TaxID=188932 RepID=A0A7X0MLR7_9SPHI|nr:hypothetical protein [Pedobacter cryoconitis]MBB6502160.1 membrane protein YdbS with pleckstrin-like domain [Pedobacter cryoconitis]